MSIADKFPWGGVEQQNDILGIHNLGQETIDRVVEARGDVHYNNDNKSWWDKFWEGGIVTIGEDGQILDRDGKPLPEPEPCLRGETKDSSSGGEDVGSGENEGSSFTREDGKTRTTKDMNGRDITQRWTVGFFGGGTWKEVETPTTSSRPVRETGTSSSKPKPFMPTAEERTLDTQWEQIDNEIRKYPGTLRVKILRELESIASPDSEEARILRERLSNHDRNYNRLKNERYEVQRQQEILQEKRIKAGKIPYQAPQPTLTEQITGTTATKNSNGTTSFRPNRKESEPIPEPSAEIKPRKSMLRGKKN